MTVTIRPDLERELHDRLKAGGYASPDQLVNAALERFMADDADVFAPGEMDALLAVGAAEAAAGQFVDEADVHRRLAERRDARRRPRP